MTRRFPPAVLAGFLVAFTVGVAPADEVSDKQKKAAEANLKQAEIPKVAFAETENLIVCGPLPEARLKTLAAALQKTHRVARKALAFEAKEEPWKGKLTVYYLPERKDFTQFMRTVGGGKPDVSSAVAIRGDEPYIVCGSEPGAKAADTDAELSAVVAGALLAAKAGSAFSPPLWVRTGFGRAAALRAGGTGSAKFAAYKTQARAAVLGGPRNPPGTIDAVWAGERPDAATLSTAMMDYMTFGPGAAYFPAFLSALRPDENGTEPSLDAVLEAAKWNKAALDAAWRKWVQGGMVAK